MDPSTDRALKILDELSAAPRETGPACLDDAYRQDVERCEILPQNQSGADKTWVDVAQRRFREHYASARRSR